MTLPMEVQRREKGAACPQMGAVGNTLSSKNHKKLRYQFFHDTANLLKCQRVLEGGIFVLWTEKGSPCEESL
jgi:hypothetical protein